MASATEDLSQFDVSNEEKDKLVAEVIRYVIFKTQQNAGCPIKREELTQLVTKNYRHRSLPGFVISEAKDKLLTIFGYELRELHRSRPSSTNQGRSSQHSLSDAKSYVIMSKIPDDAYRKYVEDVNTAHLTGFTFVVISIVQLSGGKISEDKTTSFCCDARTAESLWHHLRRVGLDEHGENHPVLGNAKQALEALVQQRFLQKDKVNGPEGNNLFYELAERSLDGPFSEKIKEYVSEIGKREVTYVDNDD
ncbi:MAGE domain containing protein [Trema orientale]|uniref:MAGE domain containing protein n=1 Tax=Trema orientale TaxID=63057 RepID=A0A2P5G1N4_TREOI|nr:MAGE domain containing protein [Trema orientale]